MNVKKFLSDKQLGCFADMELFKLFKTAATTTLFEAYDVNNMKSVRSMCQEVALYFSYDWKTG